MFRLFPSLCAQEQELGSGGHHRIRAQRCDSLVGLSEREFGLRERSDRLLAHHRGGIVAAKCFEECCGAGIISLRANRFRSPIQRILSDDRIGSGGFERGRGGRVLRAREIVVTQGQSGALPQLARTLFLREGGEMLVGARIFLFQCAAPLLELRFGGFICRR